MFDYYVDDIHKVVVAGIQVGQSSGRVYLLKFKYDERKSFFWMQVGFWYKNNYMDKILSLLRILHAYLPIPCVCIIEMYYWIECVATLVQNLILGMSVASQSQLL